MISKSRPEGCKTPDYDFDLPAVEILLNQISKKGRPFMWKEIQKMQEKAQDMEIDSILKSGA